MFVEEKIVTPEGTSIQFEDGYISRNHRAVTSVPDISITEFVANAWDAGAYNVAITIPKADGEILSVEDDGIGMSDVEFRQRWMTLNYDRQKRQGKTVVFPLDTESYVRIAYGRNGIGRHGMLCFSNYYTVETWKNGICNEYDIAESAGSEPFKIARHAQYDKIGHGTKIRAYVQRNRPDTASMTDIISARFLHDPRFVVKVNDRHIDLLEHKGIYDQREILLENGVKLNLIIIDSTKTAMKSQQHGIAFWVSGRLVGNPSWTYGRIQFLDGRVKIAKKYTLVVQTDDLIDEVLPDWTNFIDTPKMNEVYSLLKPYVDEFISSVMSEQVEELQQDIIRETRDDLKTLTLSGQRDVSVFIEAITEKSPIVSPEFLKAAVETIIKLEQAKMGEQLLNQLCQMSTNDLDRLSELLSKWDVDDILSVISEVDKRITVIEAISRVFNDKKTDELHTLHPLVLSAKWLFGAEFDSPMFVSNVALTTVVKSLFKDADYDVTELTNPRKRPDIVCLNQSTFRTVCTDRPDVEAGNVMKPDQILVIELKRGGAAIGAKEVMQAENYVRQINKSGVLHKAAMVTAYVVGATIGDIDCSRKTDSGQIVVVTYGQLVETASKKLFGLREQLMQHYEKIGNNSIVEKALKESEQLIMRNSIS